MVRARVWNRVLTHLEINKEHDDNYEEPDYQAHYAAVSILYFIFKCAFVFQCLFHFLMCGLCIRS